jgi:hypothetical protein
MTKRATFSIVAAAVLLVTSNANGNLTGTVNDGIFSHPDCLLPVQCDGQNTNTFRWGDGHSSLQATGVTFSNYPFPADPVPSVVIGNLFFFNAVSTDGTVVTEVTLQLRTGNVFITETGLIDLNHSNIGYLPLTLGITNTPNNPADPTDDASADIISFLSGAHCRPCINTDNGNPIPDKFHVRELGPGTSVEILGFFGSLGVLGFGAVADPTQGFTTSSVPGPSSLALVGGGLIALILARERRRMREPRQR